MLVQVVEMDIKVNFDVDIPKNHWVSLCMLISLDSEDVVKATLVMDAQVCIM